MGILPYAEFGDTVRTVVTLSLPGDSVWVLMIQVSASPHHVMLAFTTGDNPCFGIRLAFVLLFCSLIPCNSSLPCES